MRAILDALARLGHDVSALLAAADMRVSDLEDPDVRIPCAAVGAIYACAQSRRPTPDLDLRLAMETPLGAYPLLDYLVATSETVGEGLGRLARHARLIGAPVHVEIREDETPTRVLIDGPYTLFLTVLHLRRETQDAFRPEYVSLRVAPDDKPAVETALGCPVVTGATWAGMAVSPQAWGLPLRRRDPALRGFLERHAAEVLDRLPDGTDVVTQVRRALAKRIAQEDTRLSAVARALATSVRSLQRRLASAGVSYQGLLEQARCDAAERYLGETSLSIAEVSWLIGYSEPSAFHRAFRRWRGTSPRAYREGRRVHPAD